MTAGFSSAATNGLGTVNVCSCNVVTKGSVSAGLQSTYYVMHSALTGDVVQHPTPSSVSAVNNFYAACKSGSTSVTVKESGSPTACSSYDLSQYVAAGGKYMTADGDGVMCVTTQLTCS